MRWTIARALCRRLAVATVTLTMVTGSLPVGAFAEALTTDSTFVQTDVDQADDAALSDAAGTATDTNAADPVALDAGDAPTPPVSEIASAAGLTGAGQSNRSRRKAKAPRQLGARNLSSGQLRRVPRASRLKATMATWPASRPPRSTTSRSIALRTRYRSHMATRASPRWKCPRPSTAKMS